MIRQRERGRSHANTAHRAAAFAASAASAAARENTTDPESAPQLAQASRKCRCAGIAYAIGLAVALGTVCLYLAFVLLAPGGIVLDPSSSQGGGGKGPDYFETLLPRPAQTEQRAIHKNKNHRQAKLLEAQARSRHARFAAAAAAATAADDDDDDDDDALAEDANDAQDTARDVEFEALWSRARPIEQLARCSPENAESSSPLSSGTAADFVRFEAREGLGIPPFMSFRMLKTTSSESCCSICAALPQCKALMYTTTGPVFQNSNCFLFKVSVALRWDVHHTQAMMLLKSRLCRYRRRLKALEFTVYHRVAEACNTKWVFSTHMCLVTCPIPPAHLTSLQLPSPSRSVDQLATLFVTECCRWAC